MFCFCTELRSHLLPWSKLRCCLLWAWSCPLRAPSTLTPPASSDLASVSLNLAAALPTPPLKLVWNLSIRKLKCNVLANTGCPRKNSLIKFFLNDFPTDVDYGPTANFVAGYLAACQRSACYFFEGMTRSSRMPHSSAESWSVVHVRWEVVEEKFYQRLFSGTPCS